MFEVIRKIHAFWFASHITFKALDDMEFAIDCYGFNNYSDYGKQDYYHLLIKFEKDETITLRVSEKYHIEKGDIISLRFLTKNFYHDMPKMEKPGLYKS